MRTLPDDIFRITVGPASFAVLEGRTVSAVNQPDVASGIVPQDEMARSPTDWAAPAQASIGDDVQMSGEVIEALLQSDGSVALSLRSGVMLNETLMPPMVVQNVTPQEIVYAAARSAGFEIHNLEIHGLDDLRVEPMWVLAPIDGLHVDRGIRVGVVEFIGTDTAHEMLRRFSPPLEPVFAEPLEGASAFARVAVVASLVSEAEEEGLALIDVATAWMTTRFRYSWSHDSDGVLQNYERAPTRVAVARRDGVGVLAVDGPRRWWRKGSTIGRSAGEVAVGTDPRWSAPLLPAELPSSDQQALLALQRAATAIDPVQRVSALWEAIEFYVGKRNPPPGFTRDEVSAIVDRAINGLGRAQADRIEDVLRRFLNQPSILARVKYVLEADQVPVTAEDLALLRRLRDQRNLALHGATAAPSHEEIDRGVAVLSRALVKRVHRAGS